MNDKQDLWAEEEFEDTVAAALIACYETKVKRNRGAAPADRLTEDRVVVLRAEGPYIPSNSRLVEWADRDGRFFFDLVNDRLPLRGLNAFLPGGLVAKSLPNAYFHAHFIRQSKALGRYWHTRKAGLLYEMFQMHAEGDGIQGDRRFFTVTKQGQVVACQQQIPSNSRSSDFGHAPRILNHDEEWLQETEAWASVALQFLADRRHCWTISAQEQTARAHLGCMMEEIKSLLYARSLPMTSTGRKRPILHLVAAHKKRVKNGTDVDVTAFLKGQQVVEIGGTTFKVNPPQTLRPEVSQRSRDRYFEPA